MPTGEKLVEGTVEVLETHHHLELKLRLSVLASYKLFQEDFEALSLAPASLQTGNVGPQNKYAIVSEVEDLIRKSLRQKKN